MKKILCSLCVLAFAAGCGSSIDKEKKPSNNGVDNNATNNVAANSHTVNNGTNNVAPNNGTNNVTPNNGTNNVTPNNGTNNVTPNNGTNNGTNNDPMGSGCLELGAGDEIDFGPSSTGYTRAKSITIKNCSSTEDLIVSGIEICEFATDGTTCESGGVFGLDDLPAGLPNTTLVPGDTTSFTVTFTPTDSGAATGELTIASNDPAKPEFVVPTFGEGVDGECPEAHARARTTDMTSWSTQLNTIPLKTVEFSGLDSFDPNGTIERYEWTIVKKPINSTVRFTPSGAVAEPQLFLDLAGEYIIELEVFDDDGVGSCGGSPTVTILATPDEDIHVQLVWDTPNDADQTDTIGTDLDLHFMHPSGRWNEAPWDIFWRNPTADWGPPGPEGDPSLDIDDTDGAGPENINLDGPESGLNYSVGVYYYADSGFGPSYATVRIYIEGVKEFEYRDKFMEAPLEFWRVAAISWPTGTVTTIDAMTTGFPE